MTADVTEPVTIETRRVVAGGLAFAIVVLVLWLLGHSSTVVLSGEDTEPSHVTCSSVWLSSGITYSDDKGIEHSYSYTVSDTSDDAGTAMTDATEAECGRLRTRSTAASVLLLIPFCVCVCLALRRRNHEEEVAQLTREVETLRWRLEKQAKIIGLEGRQPGQDE